MTKKHFIVIAASALGFITMLWSAQDWYSLMSGTRMTASFCNVNAYWNCDRASLSSFGNILSVPVGVFGAIWFWVMAFIALAGSKLQLLVRAWSLLGMLSAAFMAGVLFFHLKTGCLVCLATYVFIFIAGVAAWRLANEKRADPLQSKAALGLAALGVVALPLYGIVKTNGLDDLVDETEFQNWYAQLRIEPVPSVSPLVKNPEGKIVITEFSDFGCPVCARAADSVNPYFASQADVKVQFYPFPMDPMCNRLTPRGGHYRSCDWSRVAFCAEEQGKFWEVHDRIFNFVQEARDLPTVDSVRQSLPLDQEKLTACLASPETEAKLQQAIDVADQLKIQSTPTFFVNQRRIDGLLPLPVFKRLIEELREETP